MQCSYAFVAAVCKNVLIKEHLYVIGILDSHHETTIY
jgi:hypothetical protein